MKIINFYRSVYAIIILLSAAGTHIQAQDGSSKHQFPHPINSTMGIPDPIGSYNVRLNTFRQDKPGSTNYDVSGHIGYGLFEWGGIHLRSLGVKTTPLTEIIGMVGLWRDENKEQGISLLGIVGIPTGKKDGKEHHGLAYLVGVTGRMVVHNFFTNDVILHYDITAKHYIAESGTVIRLSKNLFGVLDTRVTLGNSLPEILAMPAVKIKLFSLGFLGLGYHFPVTTATPFDRQVILQIEVGSH